MEVARERLRGVRSVVAAVVLGAVTLALAVIVARGLLAVLSVHALMSGTDRTAPASAPRLSESPPK